MGPENSQILAKYSQNLKMTKKSLKIHLKGSVLFLDTLNAYDIYIFLDKTYLGNFEDIKKNYGYHLVLKIQIFHKN